MARLTETEKTEVKNLLLGFVRKICNGDIVLYSDVETLPHVVAVLMRFFDADEIAANSDRHRD